MKPVHVPGEALTIGVAELAQMRRPLMDALRKGLRDGERFTEDYAATVRQIDDIGAAWENNRVSELAQRVSQLDGSGFDRSASISVMEAAPILGISEQATRKRCSDKKLHSRMVGRSWRVCGECVSATEKGAPCPH
jgi:hypothetical protein